MIRIEISETSDGLKGVLMQDGRGVQAFAGWLQMVALIEAARAQGVGAPGHPGPAVPAFPGLPGCDAFGPPPTSSGPSGRDL